MRTGTRIALFLLRLSGALRALIPAVASPDDLIELGRHLRTDGPGRWREQAEEGLYGHEASLLEHFSIDTGRVLCLGAGAGRDAFALARRGFQVTGLDHQPDLVDFSRAYAGEQNLSVEFICADLTAKVPGGPFDYVFLFNFVYSYVPSRKKRIALLKQIRASLAPSGKCIFHYAAMRRTASRDPFSFLRPLLAKMGRFPECGDRVTADGMFLHAFGSEEEVRAEILEAGFRAAEFPAISADAPFAVALP